MAVMVNMEARAVEWQAVLKLERSRPLLDKATVAMVIMADMEVRWQAVPKLERSRLLVDKVTVAMAIMEQPDQPPRLVLNQLPPDKVMAMVVLGQVVPKLEPNRTTRANLPLDRMVNGQSLASRAIGSAFE